MREGHGGGRGQGVFTRKLVYRLDTILIAALD